MIGPTLLLPLVLALSSAGLGQRVNGGGTEDPCARAREAASDTLHAMSPTGTRPVRSALDRASILFRMGRRKEAAGALDAALTLLDVTRKRLMTAAERASVRTAVGGLRRCIATSTRRRRRR